MAFDYSDAVRVHIAWVKEMLTGLSSPVALIPDEIRRDDLCELGKWLAEEQPRYHGQPEFENLRTLHRELPALTAEAVVLAQSGRRGDALARFSEGGGCLEKSKQLLAGIDCFMRKVEAAE